MSWRFSIWFIVFLFTNTAAIYTFGQKGNAQADSLRSALAQATSDTGRINVLLALGPTDCSDTANALKYVNEALSQAKKINWYPGCFNANNQAGNFYYVCKRDYQAAATAYQASAAIAHDHQNVADEAMSMEHVALCFYELGRYKTALDVYETTLTMKPGAETEVGIYGNIGALYSHFGDLTNALTNYLNSLRLQDSILQSKKTIDMRGFGQEAGLLLVICDIYFAMEQPDKAYDNFQTVIDISRKISNKPLEIQGLMGIARVYKTRKNYTQSISVLDSALSECIHANDPTDKVDILNEQASVYMETGNYAAGTKCAEDALALVKDKGYTQETPKCYLTLGRVYAAQNKNTEAVSYLEHAVAVYKNTDELGGEKNGLEALSSVYEKMGQPANALAAYRSYISIRDSVYNINKANELTRLDLEHTFSEEKIKQAAVFNEKMARQRVLTWCGYGGLALVLLLAFFIFKNYHTQKKYNSLLKKEQQRQQALIQAQDTVLGDIAHAQAHFVRGPISNILGLLMLYNHEDPADPFNKEIIEGISGAIQKLDDVVKDVVAKENNLRWKSDD